MFCCWKKKALIGSIFRLNFPFKMYFSENLGEKNSKMFSCGASFTFFWRNVYWCALVPQNTPCPEKLLVAHLHSGIILFAKRSMLNVTRCSESVSLDNWSVICIVTLGYVLHQTLSDSSILSTLFIQVYAGIFSYIQHYILYSHYIIKVYSSLFRHIQHLV